MKAKIAYLKVDAPAPECDFSFLKEIFHIVSFSSEKEIISSLEDGEKVDLMILDGDLDSPIAQFILLKSTLISKIPVVFIVPEIDEAVRKKALKYGVKELFLCNDEESKIHYRLDYLIRNHQEKMVRERRAVREFKMPIMKRLFDIAFSGTLLLVISPFILLIILLIRLESKGPIFYISKRTGPNFKIFNFYKFRSMRVDADANIKALAHLNQYKKNVPVIKETALDKCLDCSEMNIECASLLHLDHKVVCEKMYLINKKNTEDGTFIKIADDPRVTKVGKFIRNSSIDELPQLFNVLKGDMSIVGNRPLPIYEAEKITTDKYSQRFIAPAGITGLWQVNKRGKGNMSEEERIELDNEYASNYSFLTDIKIILKTVPALLQKENV
ncbi:MAG: Response regulator receiver protein [Chitinophagaceae bacterium]|nr:Response regulator receiver protein [Chitinophagaceae bacterium]